MNIQGSNMLSISVDQIKEWADQVAEQAPDHIFAPSDPCGCLVAQFCNYRYGGPCDVSIQSARLNRGSVHQLPVAIQNLILDFDRDFYDLFEVTALEVQQWLSAYASHTSPEAPGATEE
jgi:hypothetical protein